MRAWALAAALLAAPAAAFDDETPPIQRYLAELQLGDTFEDVQRVYPPAQDWPSWQDPRGRVTRYKIERTMAKYFPAWTQTLSLGFRRGRLVEIQAIYDEKRSREKPHEELAADFALIYGEARRTDDAFWWADDKTVLRVFPAEVPVLKGGAKSVAWRTSIQVVEKDLYRR